MKGTLRRHQTHRECGSVRMEGKLELHCHTPRNTKPSTRRGRGDKAFFPGAFRETVTCQHLDFRYLASGTVREQILVVLNKIFSNLLWQP